MSLIINTTNTTYWDNVAITWKNRVIENGGSVSFKTLSAVNSLIIGCKASGLWGILSTGRWNLAAGDQLAACQVPLVSAIGSSVDTNVNFVNGDYSEATGLQGGSGKYLSTTVAPNGLGNQNNFAAGVYTLTASSASRGALSSNFSSGALLLRYDAAAWSVRAKASSTNSTTPLGLGCFLLSRASSSTVDYTVNGASGSFSQSSNSAAGDAIVLGANGAEGTNYTGRLGGYILLPSALTQAQREALAAHWTTFNQALGR